MWSITCLEIKFYKNDIGVTIHGIRHILYLNVIIIVNRNSHKPICIANYLNVFVPYKVLLKTAIGGLILT